MRRSHESIVRSNTGHDPTSHRAFSRETAAGYTRAFIEQTCVVLVGCGALGQFIAMAVALIGFPDILFIDMDRFEESNISRSPFYRQGCNKAYAVAHGARRLCTATTDVTYRYFSSMVQWLGDAIFTNSRNVLVFSAVDSQPARGWLAQRCRLMGVPLIEGGFHAEQWNVSIFANSNEAEPCWACDRDTPMAGRLFSCDAYARALAGTGLVPATAPGAMALGAYQVGLAVRFLHGDQTLSGCTVLGDLRAATIQIMRRSLNPRCRLSHSVVREKAVTLDCHPGSTVGELLHKVSGLLPDAVIMLPSSFIRTAPCHRCRTSVRVDCPEWAISSPPVCTDCDGAFMRVRGEPPEQHGSLSEATSESIRMVSLQCLGLGPGLHLMVSGPTGDLVVALGGSNDLVSAVGDHPEKDP